MKSLKAIIYIQETFQPNENISFNIKNKKHTKFLKLIKRGYNQTLEKNIDIQIFEYYFNQIEKIEKDIYKKYRKGINLRNCTYSEAIRKIRDVREARMHEMSRITM